MRRTFDVHADLYSTRSVVLHTTARSRLQCTAICAMHGECVAINYRSVVPPACELLHGPGGELMSPGWMTGIAREAGGRDTHF